MGSSLFGGGGESTYFGPLAITIGLRSRAPKGRSQGLRSQAKKLARGRLGQGRELVEGAVPLDLLMEIFAGGCGANAQKFNLGDIGKVS